MAAGLGFKQVQKAFGLDFAPADQVRWLAPAQLLRIAAQVGIASAFSTFTDKRELQRSFPDRVVEIPADSDGGLWLDFTADTGDGFNSTYTVASLLAAPSLTVGNQTLPRGKLLVLGGDEVYPTASSDRYENKLKGPLRTALPETAVDGELPTLIALPGNHDWYDGLTAFLRVFGQQRKIGGWQTAQGRSYFIGQLPHRWWLVGLDSQLGSEIDDPQLDFFRTHLTENLRAGDNVILCVASPTWAHTPLSPDAFDSLHYFERTIIENKTVPGTDTYEPTGAHVRLWITGDSHHYARYESAPGTPENEKVQFVTCGLGGAYMSATHHLAAELTLPPEGSGERAHGEPEQVRLVKTSPSHDVSKNIKWGMLAPTSRGLPFRNPGFLSLAAGVHAFGFLLLLLLLGVVRTQSPIRALRTAPTEQVWQLGGQLALWWVLLAVVVAARRSYQARKARSPGTVVLGFGLQLALAVVALAVADWLVRLITLPSWFPGGNALPDFVLLVVMVAVVALLAGLIGSYLVALTLALSTAEPVRDWQFSAQAIEDHKGLVRIRMTPDGDLLLHPILVPDISRRWEQDADGRPVPVTPLRPELIEGPIRIVRSAVPGPPPAP